MITLHKKTKLDLHIFLVIVTILIIIGFLFIYSASSVFALEKCGNAHFYVKKHFIGLVCGLIAFSIARFIPLPLLKKIIPLGFWLTLGLTALTFISRFSLQVHGSNRWLCYSGFSFQPSELLKIALICYVAYLICKKEKNATSFLHSYLPLFIIIGASCFVLLKQPDFGLTVTLLATVCIMIFVAQFNLKYLWWSLVGMVPLGIFLIIAYPYRLKRILTFLNPWADPQGSGFQVIQSLIAIGSGGLNGLGISQSRQKFFYLPMQHTDFIFSIIAEEIGFIGCLFLISLFMLLLYFGLRLALALKDSFCALTTLGFIVLINLQAIINMCVATGIAPTKGIGLPLISYGNSALIAHMIMIGLIANMVHQNTQ